MIKKTAILIAFLIIISSVAYAQEYSCSGDTSIFSTTITIDSDQVDIGYNETCMFGCKTETGRCNPSPYDMGFFDIGIVFVLTIITIIFFYVSFKTDQQVYKLLYFLMGLLFLCSSILTIVVEVQTANKSDVLGGVETIIWILLIIVFLTTLFLFLMILKDALDTLKKKKII